MTLSFIQDFNSADDDEKLEILTGITENLTEEVYNFLFSKLTNFNDEEDEFILIEIIKVLSLYSSSKHNNQIVKMFFEIIDSSDDELVQSYAMQGLGNLKLTSKDYEKINSIIEETENEDMKGSAEMIILRKS